MRLSLALLSLVATTAIAQAPVRVTARVVDRATLQPIDGAGARVDDVATALVSSGGGILSLELIPGKHRLVIGARGYTSWQREFDFRRDTTIVVDLGHEAFSLDTVTARAATVKAKLTFRDSATNHLMVGVHAMTDSESERTSHTGTVTLHIAAGVPTLVIMEVFPYVTVKDTLTLLGDTSITVNMRYNEGAMKLLARQNAWFAQRARGRAVAGKSSLSNKDLSAGSDASIGEVLLREGFLTPRVRCIMIDDKESKAGPGFNLESLMPDQVERVERLQFGKERDIMIRVYTREYMRNVILGSIKPADVVFAGRGKICR